MSSQFLSAKITQSRTLTPQLQEAIKLLGLPYAELIPFLDQQLENNPFLLDPFDTTTLQDNISENSSDNNALTGNHLEHSQWLESIPETPISLKEHLINQMYVLLKDKTLHKPALQIIDLLDSNGYLTETQEAILKQTGLTKKAFENLLHILQQCEPAGLFSRSLFECFKLQLEERKLWSAHYEKLLNHLDLFAQGHISQTILEKKCALSTHDVTHMLKTLKELSPKPGERFHLPKQEHVIPEVFVFLDQEKNCWNVKLNNTLRTHLLFNETYYDQMKKRIVASEGKKFITQSFNHAQWLLKALQQRRQTLFRVSQEIVMQQQHFFSKGISKLKPLTLQNIAKPLGLHESTVSRVTTAKYLLCPQGVFELKHFFSSGFENKHGTSVSSASIRNTVKKIIHQENPQKPLSDNTLTAILQAQGIPLARRTVAKYREAMGIPPSFERKQIQRLQQFTQAFEKNKKDLCEVNEKSTHP